MDQTLTETTKAIIAQAEQANPPRFFAHIAMHPRAVNIFAGWAFESVMAEDAHAGDWLTPVWHDAEADRPVNALQRCPETLEPIATAIEDLPRGATVIVERGQVRKSA